MHEETKDRGLLLGYRDLRQSTYYRNDPMVKHLLRLKRLPDVATLSRMLKDTTAQSVDGLRRLLRRLVIDRLRKLALAGITLDFDGSVQSTMRRALERFPFSYAGPLGICSSSTARIRAG